MDLAAYLADRLEGRATACTPTDLFAKVLTENDDAGRHGVLVPAEAYDFLPELDVRDPDENASLLLDVWDARSRESRTIAYKYYQRYPERRLTRLHPDLNRVGSSPRLLVVIRSKSPDGRARYATDVVPGDEPARFAEVFDLIFGASLTPAPGGFVLRPVGGNRFHIDETLRDLLSRFDSVKQQGWVSSLRRGDTGVGHTFEQLVGVRENNERAADFHGIEIKCKRTSTDGAASSRKLNLFQQGPIWRVGKTMVDRLRILGKLGEDGLYRLYSQVTVRRNNLGICLRVAEDGSRIVLDCNAEDVGDWSRALLEKRLTEKHSRLVVVAAEARMQRASEEFRYLELTYCEQPSFERFLSLVGEAGVVFEFLMSERPLGAVRNHGYPWRLAREVLLDRLFELRIRLRSRTD